MERRIIEEPAGAQMRRPSDVGEVKRASNLLNSDILDQQGEKIGQVKDLVADLSSGQVPIAVISTNGFLGVGERLIAVPTTALQPSPQENAVLLQIDRQQLATARAFDRQNWPALTQDWVQEVYTQYGMQPPAGLERAEFEVRREIREPAGVQRLEPSAVDTDAQADWILRQYQRGKGPAEALDRDLRESPGPIVYPRYRGESPVITDPAGAPPTTPGARIQEEQRFRTEQRVRTERDPFQRQTFQRGELLKVSDLSGMQLRSPQGDNLGTVRDVVIDLDTGHIAYAVVSAGGFLGIGDRRFAVPVTQFQPSQDQRHLVSQLSRQQLRAAPEFDERRWQQHAGRTYISEVYRYYGEQPYWQVVERPGFRDPAGARPMEDQLQEQRQELRQQREEFRHEREQRREQQDQFPREEIEHREIQEPAGARPGVQPRQQEFRQDQQQEFRRDQQEVRREARRAGDPIQQEIIVRANDLRGMKVEDRRGQELGTIRDVVIDLETGNVAYVVLSTGGFLGMGADHFVAPLTSFTPAAERDVLTFKEEATRLMPARPFDEGRWEQAARRDYIQQVYRHYGQQPYWEAQGRTIRDPAGAELDQDQQLRDPAGAQPGLQQQQREQQQQRFDQQQPHQRQQQFPRQQQPYDGEDLGSGGGDLEQRGEQQREVREPAGAPPTGQQRDQQLRQDQQRRDVIGVQREERREIRRDTRKLDPVTDLKVARAEDIRGMRVEDQRGENLGTIRDVVVDMQTGNVAFVVLGRGGFLGIGQNHFALPLTLLTPAADRDVLLFRDAATRLMPARPFDEGNWEQAARREYIQQIYRHYGEQPYWEAAGIQMREPAGAQPQQQQQQRELQQQQQREQQQQQQQRQQQRLDEPAGARGTQQRTEVRQETRVQQRQQTEFRRDEIRPMAEFNVARARDITGMTVRDQRGDDLGTIRDLLIDIETGHVAYLVLSRGGFLGIGANHFALPITLLQVTADERALIFEGSPAQLKAAVPFDEGNWELGAQREYIQEVYTHYGEQPYWDIAVRPGIREPAGAQADQEQQLQRDQQQQQELQQEQQRQQQQLQRQREQQQEQREQQQRIDEPAGAQAPAAGQQDAQLTRQIQRQLTQDPQTASAAQNLQISASQGTVTLKGTVSNEQEKRQIEEQVKEMEGVDQVDNQLEVRGGAQQEGQQQQRQPQGQPQPGQQPL